MLTVITFKTRSTGTLACTCQLLDDQTRLRVNICESLQRALRERTVIKLSLSSPAHSEVC